MLEVSWPSSVQRMRDEILRLSWEQRIAQIAAHEPLRSPQRGNNAPGSVSHRILSDSTIRNMALGCYDNILVVSGRSTGRQSHLQLDVNHTVEVPKRTWDGLEPPAGFT